MKRALVLLSLTAATLAGCASASNAGDDGTLRASLTGGREGPRISLSEPAYVAVFSVGTTSGSARLVYPDPATEQTPLRAGTQRLAEATRTWQLNSRYSGNVVMYMVASREPLDLSAFQADPVVRQEVAGTELENNVQQISNALALAVLPDPESEGWTDSMLRWSFSNGGSELGAVPARDVPAGGSCEPVFSMKSTSPTCVPRRP